MKRKISVTQKHIDYGLQEDHKSCPIALAFQEIGITEYMVLPEAISKTYNLADHHSLPRSARRFIKRFDEGLLPVQPFNFIINI